MIPDKYRLAVAGAAHRAFRRHLTAADRGTVCLRIETGGRYLVTPRATSLERVSPEDLCLVDQTGTLLSGPAAMAPPDEIRFLLKAFQVRPDVGAITHFYPPYSSAYAERGRLFACPAPAAGPGIGEMIKVSCRECHSRFAGLCSCRTDIRSSYRGAAVLLLEHDGVVTLGADLDAALALSIFVEHCAKTAFIAAGRGRQTVFRSPPAARM